MALNRDGALAVGLPVHHRSGDARDVAGSRMGHVPVVRHLQLCFRDLRLLVSSALLLVLWPVQC